jgi:hypothetical protein
MVQREAKQGKFAGRSFWGCGLPKMHGNSADLLTYAVTNNAAN